MAIVSGWTCPSCKGTVTTSYCPACGESPPRESDLMLRGLLGHLFRALTSVDGRLIRSLRYLVFRPGLLTAAYVQGQRKPHLGPFQLFLIANVLFFAVQSLTNTNIFSTTLDSHLHGQDWSTVAQELVTQRLETLHTTLDRYAPVFDQAVVLNAKSLIVLMVLPFALLLPVLFYGDRQPFAAHVVFAVHLYAFLLLLFCVSLAISAIDAWLGGAGLKSPGVDNLLSLFNLAASATYLYLATGVVYRASGALRVIKVLVLTLALGGLVLGYRFVLFLITLYST